MWTLIFLYFDAVAHNMPIQINPQYEQEMNQIVSYFSNKDEVIDSVEPLKFYMYDTETIRNILAL